MGVIARAKAGVAGERQLPVGSGGEFLVCRLAFGEDKARLVARREVERAVVGHAAQIARPVGAQDAIKPKRLRGLHADELVAIQRGHAVLVQPHDGVRDFARDDATAECFRAEDALAHGFGRDHATRRVVNRDDVGLFDALQRVEHAFRPRLPAFDNRMRNRAIKPLYKRARG